MYVYNSVSYVYNNHIYIEKSIYIIISYNRNMSCKLDIMIYIELASNSFICNNKWIWCYVNKTEANLASVRSLAARCVRVIHAQCVLQFALLSRTLLRSSSNNEPSDPPYRIVMFFYSVFRFDSYSMTNNNDFCWLEKV